MSLTREAGSTFRRIDLEAVRVGLILKGMDVTGTIHVEPRSGRFSDSWESFRRLHDTRKFFPVTDATITRQPGADPIQVAFLVIDCDEVIAVYPIEA